MNGVGSGSACVGFSSVGASDEDGMGDDSGTLGSGFFTVGFSSVGASTVGGPEGGSGSSGSMLGSGKSVLGRSGLFPGIMSGGNCRAGGTGLSGGGVGRSGPSGVRFGSGNLGISGRGSSSVGVSGFSTVGAFDAGSFFGVAN